LSSVNDVLEQIAIQLRLSHWKLATAESCTGGLLGATCTAISGSSMWYAGGCVTYTNALKQTLTSVSEETLDTYGAVSVEVAREMCVGVAKVCEAQVSISTTGIAGPTGGTESKPVGTVCIGCSVDGETHASQFHFQGDRQSVRDQAVQASLEMCLSMLRRNADAR